VTPMPGYGIYPTRKTKDLLRLYIAWQRNLITTAAVVAWRRHGDGDDDGDGQADLRISSAFFEATATLVLALLPIPALAHSKKRERTDSLPRARA
jgi:hypothetical protein